MTSKGAELPIVLVPHPHVRVDRAVMGGSPFVAGSRVPVRRLWGFYRGGAGVDTLIRRFPKLGAAKIFDALAFAWDNQEVIEADLAREQSLLDSDAAAGKTTRPTSQLSLSFDEPALPTSRAAVRPAPAAKAPAPKPAVTTKPVTTTKPLPATKAAVTSPTSKAAVTSKLLQSAKIPPKGANGKGAAKPAAKPGPAPRRRN